LLGIELKPGEIEFYLGQLGLKIVGSRPRPVGAEAGPEPVTFAIPSWRVDLKREADLIEEVARLHGVDRIPATAPRGALGAHPFDAVYDQLAEARRLLTGLGLDEAQGQTLIGDAAARLLTPNPVLLHNPLSSDMNALRPSLLPGLLDALRHNLNRKVERVALFEVGRVFQQGGPQTLEGWRVALALTGPRDPTFWQGADREAKFDSHDLIGLLEDFLEAYGVRGVALATQETPGSLYVESAAVTLGGKVPLGQLGRLRPDLARLYDLRDPVLLAELDLQQLLARRSPAKSFKPLPLYPGVRRDLALLVPERVTHDAVLQAVRKARPPHLESVTLFDVFRGKHVPAGQKSMAYAFSYRHPDRTLTDAEVNPAHDKLVAHLTAALPAQVRA
jgi:phenylalanyl-tRNA synthetase beta chain